MDNDGGEGSEIKSEKEPPPPEPSTAPKKKSGSRSIITQTKGSRANKIREDLSAIEIDEINHKKYGWHLKIGLFREYGVVVVHAAGVPPPSESPTPRELKRFKLSMLQVIQETNKLFPDLL